MQFNIFKHFRVLLGVRGLSSPSNSGQGYIPRGRGTNTSGGSATPGGGPISRPNGGSNGGGQTNTSSSSVKNGSGPVKQPNGGSNGGRQTNTSAGSGRPGGRAV